ncbi:hypothetical protein BJV77DRAFT_139391 [Russula vinacea]|nr:hypothetical protein BJV77DRAFT_139391 [Russula vinacea]
MSEFDNPAVSAQTLWGIVKLWHTINGLYLWEFFTTLDYEWRVIRGYLPYRWTIWIYSTTRVAALVGVVLCLVSMDVATPVHCQVLMSFSAIIFYLSATAASLLIVFRIIAIWNRNKFVVTLAIAVWGISAAFHIQSAARLRSIRVPGQNVCEPIKTESSVLSFIPTIISDIALLLIMFVGLLVLRRHGGGTIGLSRLLWKQGVVWLALAVATEIPPLVLIVLNLNNQYNILFETPCLVTMIIAATRMHRSLVDFAWSSDGARERAQVSSLVFTKTRQTDTAPITSHRIEIAVDMAFEQHSAAQKVDGVSFDMSKESAPPPTASLPSIPPMPSV